MTQKQIEFIRELGELLAKHGVEIEATDDGASYGQNRALITIYSPSPYFGLDLTSITADSCKRLVAEEEADSPLINPDASLGMGMDYSTDTTTPERVRGSDAS